MMSMSSQAKLFFRWLGYWRRYRKPQFEFAVRRLAESIIAGDY
jgi:hypothetical protein